MSQRAFLRNLARGEAYQMEAPTLWDVDFEMAVSQADLEDREQSGAASQVGRHQLDATVFAAARFPPVVRVPFLPSALLAETRVTPCKSSMT